MYSEITMPCGASNKKIADALLYFYFQWKINFGIKISQNKIKKIYATFNWCGAISFGLVNHSCKNIVLQARNMQS